MDGGVDRREWTLQHRKAADITLTPPQADLDADCLDVNVKGPGEKKKSASYHLDLINYQSLLLTMNFSSPRWLHPTDAGITA